MSGWSRNLFLQRLIERELNARCERLSRADELLEADNDFTAMGEGEELWER